MLQVERAEDTAERYVFQTALRAAFLSFAVVRPQADLRAEALAVNAEETAEEYVVKAEAIAVSLVAIADCMQTVSTFGFAGAALVAVSARTGAAIAEAKIEKPPNIIAIFFICCN